MKAGPPWRLMLPMYNVTPGLALAWERLLRAVIAGLRDRGWTDAMEVVPPPDDLMAFWRGPNVLLTQTCGYPFITGLLGEVCLIATPRFDVPGCAGAHYRSVIVVREAGGMESLEALRGGVAVINQPHSQSGMNALRHAFAPLARAGRFFSGVQVSGSHLASLAAVQAGTADVAAIDCVTWAYATHHAGAQVAGLRALQWTDSAPGLPLIGSMALTAFQVAELQAVLDAFGQARPDLMAELALTGFSKVPPNDYQIIAEQEAAAKRLGYGVIA